MQRTSAGGVTLLTTPAPGPLTARLTFGCGARDETAPTMGVTRVIEALVRAEIGTPLHEFTTTVGTAETHFTATGTPPAVARFLHTVCRTLSDLPLHRTAHATRLLGMDGTRIPEHRAVEPLSARFGPHAAGLVLHHDNTMYESITPDMVRAHAATFFTRGNAVLALDGPTPDALALPLPDAPKPQRTTPRARTGASWQHRPVPTVSLLLTSGASSAAADAAHTILRRRVERSARDLQAVGNDVTAHRVPRDRLTLDRIIVLDVLEGRAEQAAESLWYEARHLATEGATETELHAFTTHARAAQDFTDSHWRTLERAVTAELFGTPFLDDRTLLETLKAVTPQDVRHAAQQALTDAVIVVPPQAFLRLRTPQGAALPHPTAGAPTAPRHPEPSSPCPA